MTATIGAFTRAASVIAATYTLLALVACVTDRAAAPEDRHAASAILASGGDQHAGVGEALPESISVRVLDARGAPLTGIEVHWVVQQDSDRVDPASSLTNGEGIATTMWTLGPLPGEHTVHADVSGFGPVVAHASAAPATLEINSVHLLRLLTADGSGQTVHPDFVSVSDAGPLNADFLAITAYPFGNAAWENPSVYTSLDRVHWNAPSGATNPVATPDHGFLSDPDVVFNPVTHELWLYYRQVDVLNDILLIKSSDGVTWSAPRLVTNGLNHTVVSPTVVRRSELAWLMWAVNGQGGCTAPDTWVELRRSSDGEVWSAPERVSLPHPPGLTPWHIDVQWIPSRDEYWAVYNAKPAESCTSPALYLATSKDGVEWTTYPSPLLEIGTIPEFRDVVYRTTFRYRPETDVVTFWYSGAQYDGVRYTWSSAVQRRPRDEVFEAIGRPAGAALVAQRRRGVPALLDPP